MGEQLVIIGNGMAATRLVEKLSSLAPDRYSIAVVGDEPSLAYNRVLLTSVLAGGMDSTTVELKTEQWWCDRGITLTYGRPAVAVDRRASVVRLRGGAKLSYSKLVFATGSQPIRLPLPGANLSGVVTFRQLHDVEQILARARPGTRAVVIGGGVLGLETAHALAKAGANVSVLHLMDRLMERQIDARAAALLQWKLEACGIRVLLDSESVAIHGRRKVMGLRLKSGATLPADLIVMAVGTEPNVRLARGAELEVNHGIVVDDDLRTSDPNIFAIGDCAEHRGTCYGRVEPAYDQADVLAQRLSGQVTRYEGSVPTTHLNIPGIDVFSAGDVLGAPGSQTTVLSDPGRGAYRKLVVADGQLTGAVLIGDTGDALWYLELIRKQSSIAALSDGMIFGRAFAQQKIQTNVA